MPIVLLVWLALFTISIGCGALTASLLLHSANRRARAGWNLFQLFWLGYSFILAALQFISLALPIRLGALAIIALLAAIGFALRGRIFLHRLQQFSRKRERRPLARLLIGITTIGVVACQASGPVVLYDTNLYHLQSVQWAARFPVVPGLVNLHARLAYNNSVHLFAALSESLWKPGESAHLALGLLFTVVLLQWFHTLASPRANGTAKAYCLLTLPYLFGKLWSNEISSLSTDLPMAVLCLVALLELLQMGTPKRFHERHLLLAICTSAAAMTTKLIAMPTFAIAAIASTYIVFHDSTVRRRVLFWLALPALLVIGFIARSAVLSGWLWFPLPFGDLHLPWSLPPDEAVAAQRAIKSWARMPGRPAAEVLDHGMAHWLIPWWRIVRRSRELFLLCLASAIFLVRAAIPQRTNIESRFALRAAIGAVLLSLGLWFQSAPNLRFGSIFFWLLLAIAATPQLALALRSTVGRCIAAAIVLALTSWNGGLDVYQLFTHDWLQVAPLETFPITSRVLPSGLEVKTPVGAEDRCANIPVPCTPYPGHQRWRIPGQLKEGFQP